MGCSHLSGVGKASVNLFARQAGVVLNEIFFGPAISETFDDELDGQTGTCDDRFANHHFWIRGDHLFPVGHRPSSYET
jgi:hypothetical protein